MTAERRSGRMLSGFAIGLAAISYSLYVIHFPATIGLHVSGVIPSGVQPAPVNLVQYAATLVLVIAIGTAFWFAFEKHTGKLRSLIERSPQKPKS